MVRNSKRILLLLLISLVSTCLAAPEPITITHINLGKMQQDLEASEFSTVINLNANIPINHWKLGFYMPRSFNFIGTANPRLSMKICDSHSYCSKLHYIKRQDVTLPDESAGYTTVLAPVEHYLLKPHTTYTISLRHNNQWSPTNISAAPQNFFLIDDSQVFPLSTSKKDYTFLDYDSNQTTSIIQHHIHSIWHTPKKSNNSIIPSPVTYQLLKGNAFVIYNNLNISDSLDKDTHLAKMIQHALAKDLNIQTHIAPSGNTGIVIEKLNNPAVIKHNPEGYQIEINQHLITIKAIDKAGAFYAFETLRQLWNTSTTIKPAKIIDYPRFPYRGILLDTARHYFTVPEIQNFMDIMAAHKLNSLHIHFSDDEAFRIALPDFPALSQTGASRGYGQPIGPMMFLQQNLDKTNKQHSHYPVANTSYTFSYSPNDIRELIHYANQRNITIIPEIDLPGHARALIKSLPEAFVDPNDHSTYLSVQGYSDDVIPVCKYGKGDVINPIVNDVTRLFRDQKTLYAIQNEISLGADEVSPDAWSQDDSCTKQWANLSALQKSHLFFQLFSQNNPALKISGWQQLVQNNDESLDSNRVPPHQTGHVYVWSTSDKGIPQAVSLANAGYPTVLAFADNTYFDLAYTPDVAEPGFNWGTSFSDTHAALLSADNANKVILGIENKNNIRGLEGALWSENIPNYHHLLYMALPKMAGLSEAAWSQKVTGNAWPNLAIRLGFGEKGFLAYLHHAYGATYRGYPKGIELEIPRSSRSTFVNLIATS